MKAPLRLLPLALLSAAAHADTWSVTVLHDPAHRFSSVTAGAGATAYGEINDNTASYAAAWTGLNTPATAITPAGLSSVQITAVSGGVLGGWASDVPRAVLWSDTSGYTSLHPASATYSFVNAIGGTMQVGHTSNGSFGLAAMWTGSAASYVNLAPSGAFISLARATDGVKQGGYAVFDNTTYNSRAILWTGSATDYSDLTPTGINSAQIHGMSATDQVGVGDNHAMRWLGSASIYTDLNPAGATSSFAGATDGTRIAGYAKFSGANHAGIWTDGGATFTDLHSLLGSTYASSSADTLWSDGATLYVGGTAEDADSEENHAVIWRLTAVPEPAEYGAMAAGTLAALAVIRRRRRRAA